MGYTHHWTTHRDLTENEWEHITSEVWTLLEHHLPPGLCLTKQYGTQEAPQVDENRIQFNGCGEFGHESFILDRAQHDDFCKTARKPYDLVVAAVLIVVAGIAEDAITVRSNGGPKDWQPALDWVNDVLGIHHLPPGL